jgi:hypothetical protein
MIQEGGRGGKKGKRTILLRRVKAAHSGALPVYDILQSLPFAPLRPVSLEVNEGESGFRFELGRLKKDEEHRELFYLLLRE